MEWLAGGFLLTLVGYAVFLGGLASFFARASILFTPSLLNEYLDAISRVVQMRKKPLPLLFSLTSSGVLVK